MSRRFTRQFVPTLASFVVATLTILSTSFVSILRAADEVVTTTASDDLAPTTQPVAAAAADVAKWFTDLSNPDPGLRTEARDHLLLLSRDDLPALRDAVAKAGQMTPGQVSQLREIVTQAFLSSEQYEADDSHLGFLGVRFPETHDFSGPVVVADRIIGLPAYASLRDGDVILRIGSIRASYEMLSTTVGQTPVGQSVELEVLRRGQIMKINVVVAPRPKALPQAGGPGAIEVPLALFQKPRMDALTAYWDANFAPLLERKVS